jgi:hypothetical protein
MDKQSFIVKDVCLQLYCLAVDVLLFCAFALQERVYQPVT